MAKEGKWKVADLELFKKYPREIIVEETPLSVGDVLITENGEEEIISLKELKTRPREETVYDLKLGGDSTYIANGFIVHNCLP